jgi:hypothetical protein
VIFCTTLGIWDVSSSTQYTRQAGFGAPSAIIHVFSCCLSSKQERTSCWPGFEKAAA